MVSVFSIILQKVVSKTTDKLFEPDMKDLYWTDVNKN